MSIKLDDRTLSRIGRNGSNGASSCDSIFLMCRLTDYFEIRSLVSRKVCEPVALHVLGRVHQRCLKLRFGHIDRAL